MCDSSVFNVKKFGASGIARPTETLTLENFEHGGWLRWPQGLTATIYHPLESAEYDSVGIQKAIDAAHAAGGGTVFVPAGHYLIAPIELRSRVNLHLEPGACLWGSPHMKDYSGPEVETSVDKAFGRKDRGLSGDGIQRLVTAHDAEDVSITGMGQISGQSPHWIIPWLNSKPTDWIVGRPTDTLLFYNCQRVLVEGIRILDTPAWTLVFDSCRHVQVRGLQIKTMDIINSDGIDLVNSSLVTISDCDIHCTDDAICLKNTDPESTMRTIAVTNCLIRTLCNGLKIGTDTAGNFEDITFNNIVISNIESVAKDAEGGINLCALDGGFVRNINISNIVMRNVHCPFYLLSGCREKQQQAFRTPRPGLMERISISNIQADGIKCASFIIGHEESPIRDVNLENIRIRKTRDFYDHKPGPLRKPDRYPTPYMYGSRQGDDLPAHSLYMRHAKQIYLQNFRAETVQPDSRPSIVAEQSDVKTDCPIKIETLAK